MLRGFARALAEAAAPSNQNSIPECRDVGKRLHLEARIGTTESYNPAACDL